MPPSDLAAVHPTPERERLRTLYAYDILDTEPDERFDRVARLAKKWFDTPIALITLIDHERQWFKSCLGLDVDGAPRDLSFCTYTIKSDDVLVVEDARTDERFASNPFVTGPAHIRFYAGAPLITPNGHRLGTLCVIDTTPRSFSDEDEQTLVELAAVVVDGLELRREVAERERSRRQYRTLFESANDAILILRPEDEVVLAANARAAALYGVERDALVGQSLHAYSRDAERGAVEVERVRKDGKVVFDTEQMRADGTPISVRVSASLIEYGGRTAILSHNRDITERKQAEATLRASEERFQTLLASLDDIVWAAPADASEALYLNDAVAAIYGRPVADFLANPSLWYEAVHPDDRERARASGRTLETGEPSEVEYRIVRPDGAVRWLHDRKYVVRDEDGRVLRLGGIATDITERKRAEEALRASEARYRGVVENVRDAVLQTDTEGRWTFLNPAWEQITGFSVEESLGHSLFEFVHPDERHRHDELFGPLFRGEIPFVRFETRYITKAGGFRHVEVHAQLTRDEAGAVSGTSGTVSDVTDTLRFEAEREARERTEEMLRLKSTFLNNMSHEIRTPLTGILGFAAVLAEEVAEEHRDFARLIHESAGRLLDTLNSVLALAQIEGRGLEMDPQWVDVAEDVSATVRLLHPLAEQKELALLVEATPTTVRVDRAALNRIVNNLVGNAVKFTEAGSVRVAVEPDEDHVILRVIDTGIGVPASFLPHIFDEFEQASQGDARSHEGSGLGLSITQRLVALLGGTIEVESTVGEGTTFTVRLPRQQGREAAPDPGANAPALQAASA